MDLRIETSNEKKLVGRSVRMSFAANKTPMLWQQFMPRRNEILNRMGSEFYSAEVFDNIDFFKVFNTLTEFTKIAAVEVPDFNDVPAGMEQFTFPGGLYAVFIYKGTPANAAGFYQSIFTEWLPASAFVLDHRPHFAVMGEKYKHNDPSSEEEIWIPVKKKGN